MTLASVSVRIAQTPPAGEGTAMDHRRGMTTLETGRLAAALRGNGDVEGGGLALLMGRDTSFTGTADELPDEEVIGAVRSVPTHY